MITSCGSKGLTSTPSHPAARACFVDRLERAGQQQDRNVLQLGRLLDEHGDFIAITFRHSDIRQDDVGRILLHPVDRLLPIADGNDLDVFLGKRQFDDALDRDAIVCEQQLWGIFVRAYDAAWSKSIDLEACGISPPKLRNRSPANKFVTSFPVHVHAIAQKCP